MPLTRALESVLTQVAMRAFKFLSIDQVFRTFHQLLVTSAQVASWSCLTSEETTGPVELTDLLNTAQLASKGKYGRGAQLLNSQPPHL